jgi:hypothetical protein
MTRLPQSNAASVTGLFPVLADWATLPNRPGSATDHAVASVNQSRNTGIDREADELAAAVANLNEDWRGRDGRDAG